jgi:hypothetical protein
MVFANFRVAGKPLDVRPSEKLNTAVLNASQIALCRFFISSVNLAIAARRLEKSRSGANAATLRTIITKANNKLLG